MTLLQRRVLLALLEESREGAATWEGLLDRVRASRASLEGYIRGLASEGLLTLSGGLIEASRVQRLSLAVRAVELGADMEDVSKALGWREFEEMAAYIFEENGFQVRQRLRFRAGGRRWEVDVLALRRPYILCAECKRWRRGLRGSTLEEVAEGQRRRVEALKEAGVHEVLGVRGWGGARLLPLVLSLTPPPRRLLDGIPIVPILELPSFLEAFEGYLEELWHLRAEVPPRKTRRHQRLLRSGR